MDEGSIEGPTCADEALNTLLFRICTGLGFNQKDIILTEREFRHVRAQYEDRSAQWLEGGQKHYEALLLCIPESLRSVMDEKWFHKRLGKGSPKVTKWESDDLRGITGFLLLTRPIFKVQGRIAQYCLAADLCGTLTGLLSVEAVETPISS